MARKTIEEMAKTLGEAGRMICEVAEECEDPDVVAKLNEAFLLLCDCTGPHADSDRHDSGKCPALITSHDGTDCDCRRIY